MRKKALYIFDMDGTLFNTLGDLSVAVNHALSAFGLKNLSEEKVKGYIGNGSLKLIERCLEGADAPLEKVHKVYSDFYAEHCTEATVPYPGVLEFLKSSSAKIALVTNKPRRPGMAILRRFGVLERFDALVFGDTTPAKKPAPDGFLSVLGQLHIPKNDAVMIGDDAPDILGAKNSGIESAFIENGFGKRASFAPVEPDYSIPHFADLPHLQFR